MEMDLKKSTTTHQEINDDKSNVDLKNILYIGNGFYLHLY